jgi:hypothetical protein
MLKNRGVQAVLLTCVLVALADGLAQTIGASADPTKSLPQAAQSPLENYVAPTGPELPLSQIQQIALSQANRSGEPSPSDISVAHGTFGAAQAVMDPQPLFPQNRGASPSTPGLEAWLNSSVYLVIMHGNFTLDGPRPRGYPAPTGTVMALILDAHKGIPEGRYIGEKAPNAAQLGPVTQLRVTPTAGETSAQAASKRQKSAIMGVLYVSGRGYSHVASGYPVLVTKKGGGSLPIIARATTKKNGTFMIPIHPGSYRIGGNRPTGYLCSKVDVTVRAHRRTYARLDCAEGEVGK